MMADADSIGKSAPLLETDNLDWIPIMNIPTSQQYTQNDLYIPNKKKFFNRTEVYKPYVGITRNTTSAQKHPDFDLVQNESSVDTVKHGDPIPNCIHIGTKRKKTICLVDAQTQTDMSGDDFNKLQASNAVVTELKKIIGELLEDDVSI